MCMFLLRRNGEGRSRLQSMPSNLVQGRVQILAQVKWPGPLLMRLPQAHPGRGLSSKAELDHPVAQGRLWSLQCWALLSLPELPSRQPQRRLW